MKFSSLGKYKFFEDAGLDFEDDGVVRYFPASGYMVSLEYADESDTNFETVDYIEKTDYPDSDECRIVFANGNELIAENFGLIVSEVKHVKTLR